MISNRRIRLLVFGFGLLLLASIVYLLVAGSKHAAMAKVDIQVIPDDASVTLDGKGIKSGDKYIEPGTHEFTAAKSGFETTRLSITVKAKDKRDVILLPAPVSAEAKKWLSDHPGIQRQREALEAKNILYIQQAIKANYPIINDLPLDTLHYQIDYGQSKKYPDDPTKIALFITASPVYRDMAMHWIKFKGYDPAKFEIIYTSNE